MSPFLSTIEVPFTLNLPWLATGVPVVGFTAGAAVGASVGACVGSSFLASVVASVEEAVVVASVTFSSASYFYHQQLKLIQSF